MATSSHTDSMCRVLYHTTERFLGWVRTSAGGEKPSAQNGSFNEFRPIELGDTINDPFDRELAITEIRPNEESGNWDILARPVGKNQPASRWQVEMVRERLNRQEWSALAPSRVQRQRARNLGIPEVKIAGMNRGQLNRAIADRERQLEQERFDRSLSNGGLAVGTTVYRYGAAGQPRRGPYRIKSVNRDLCAIFLEKCPGAFKPWNLTQRQED